MTREENLLYRRRCPYDAMGDYSLMIVGEKKKSESLMKHFKTHSEKEPVWKNR